MLTTREQYRIMKLLTKHYKSSKIVLKILLGRVTVGSSCQKPFFGVAFLI
ncbi:hypothetical protein EFN87_06375 [Lactococcus lactis]|nr:hypothetical protein [Lactococcus lactis]